MKPSCLIFKGNKNAEVDTKLQTRAAGLYAQLVDDPVFLPSSLILSLDCPLGI